MSLPEGYSLRRASAGDIDTLVAHRRAMFVDMGYQDQTALDTMATNCRTWLLIKMDCEEYLAWLATAPDGSVVAGTGLWLMDWPPHMIGSGRRGNILNVYTEPEFRRRGLAGELVNTAMQWCRSNGIDVVVLHSSNEGRRLYESMGFAASNEMRIKL
jgi:GNAT superfamily N-acetyltransferase